VVEQKGTNNFVYSIPGEEGQQRSTPLNDAQLIAEFEKDNKKDTVTNKKKKKTKK
jgi:hypothetical protein